MKNVEEVQVDFFRIPTEKPESDGTLTWSSTGMLCVQIHCQGYTGLGYSYTTEAAAQIVKKHFVELIVGRGPYPVQKRNFQMQRSVRNFGHQGVAACALSAVDIALWDLKAQLLKIPLVELLGVFRDRTEAYASGGFTSQSPEELQNWVGGWKEKGFRLFKIKIGRHPEEDIERVAAVRNALEDSDSIFIDANGAYDVKPALALAERVSEFGVSWFEEPVSSDNREGLKYLRQRLPPGMELSAGEYGWDLFRLFHLLKSQCVDVLQIDVTRCGGITGFLRAAEMARAFHVPLSCHTAPHLHAPLACSLDNVRHLEVFADHDRIENELFENHDRIGSGWMETNREVDGHGLRLKRDIARQYLQ